jgi:cytochrome bd-type quinol oxidase subunit 1
MITLVAIPVILLYAAVSVVFVLYNLRRKYRRSRWYDYPLLLPVLVLMRVISIVAWVTQEFFRKQR